MNTVMYNTTRYLIYFNTSNQELRIIDNEKTTPLKIEKINGNITLGEFCQNIETIKTQLEI